MASAWAPRGHCRIVVVSSMAAVVPAPGQAMYSATKLALHGYFATLQSELNSRRVTLSSETVMCTSRLPMTAFGAHLNCILYKSELCGLIIVPCNEFAVSMYRHQHSSMCCALNRPVVHVPLRKILPDYS